MPFRKHQKYNPPRAVLITGASSGIGAALAVYYAGEGVDLYLSGRHEERLAAVKDKCESKGAHVHTACLDVTDEKRMAIWVTEADQKTPLDLVIANAGISGGSGGGGDGRQPQSPQQGQEKSPSPSLPLCEPVAQARTIYNVNVQGVFNTVEPVLDRMLQRQSGQIAIISSLASFSGWGGAPGYSSSKGAVRLYGEALRVIAKARNVRVNVVCPGFIKTPLTDKNPFPMPFLMSPEDSAVRIARGLAANKGRIVFPWQMYALCGFVGLLPYWLTARLMRRMPDKPSL